MKDERFESEAKVLYKAAFTRSTNSSEEWGKAGVRGVRECEVWIMGSSSEKRRRW